MKLVSEYTRTVLSELQVATRGREGWGAVSQVRSWEGGVRSERWDMEGGIFLRVCVILNCGGGIELKS